MLVQRSLGLQYGNKLMLFVLVETKSATPAFDHSIDGGLTFGDLMVFFYFRFDESLSPSLAPQKIICQCPYMAIHDNTPHRYEEYYRPQPH
jgi:hypothetical protein